ncbi:hypothetical protein SteCoe_5040 [Stentor coeruleus]|uniref:Uncharacterized protein n=1 Tax=Stentor coeruleus TaxID=5963 RepID=A0A1R2CTE8_9CILI|nr:hypothetical protein SteCoe_5040 [Stentor coeruleus]
MLSERLSVNELYKKKPLKKAEAPEFRYLTPFRLKFSISKLRLAQKSCFSKDKKITENKSMPPKLSANSGLIIQMLTYQNSIVKKLSPKYNQKLNESFDNKKITKSIKTSPRLEIKNNTIRQSKSFKSCFKPSNKKLNQSSILNKKHIKYILEETPESRSGYYYKIDQITGWDT